MTQPLPQQIGPYTILEESGRDAAGRIYRAWDQAKGDYASLYIAESWVAEDPFWSRWFIQSAKWRRSSQRPYLAPIYAVGETSGYLIAAAKPITTASLAALLQQNRGKLPLAEVVALIRDAAAVLDNLHDSGWVYGNLDIDHVLYDKAEGLELHPFALMHPNSRHFHAPRPLPRSPTPGFMSPEQARGEEVTAASDIYSLGVLAYVSLFGELPFRASTQVELLRAIAYDQPRFPAWANSKLPERVVQALLGALHKEPERRYQSAGLFARALEEAASEISDQSRRARMIMGVTAGAAVSFVVLACTIWLYMASSRIGAPGVYDRQNVARNAAAIVELHGGHPAADSKMIAQAEAAASAIHRALAELLERGLLTFDAPPTMRTGEVYPIVARIVRSVERVVETDIQVGLTQFGGISNPESIRVSPTMKAVLHAESSGDFTITSLSEDEQFIDKQEYTEWQWRVSPQSWGTKKLILSVTAYLDVEGEEHQRWSLPVYERVISVQIDPYYELNRFWAGNWRWLLAAGGVLVVAVLLLWLLWRSLAARALPRRMSRAPRAIYELDEFAAALQSAYPERADLKRMVHVELGEKLASIAGGETMDEIVFNLILWAEKQGNVEKLVRGALHANRGNPDLRQFVAKYFSALLPPA